MVERSRTIKECLYWKNIRRYTNIRSLPLVQIAVHTLLLEPNRTVHLHTYGVSMPFHHRSHVRYRRNEQSCRSGGSPRRKRLKFTLYTIRMVREFMVGCITLHQNMFCARILPINYRQKCCVCNIHCISLTKHLGRAYAFDIYGRRYRWAHQLIGM